MGQTRKNKRHVARPEAGQAKNAVERMKSRSQKDGKISPNQVLVYISEHLEYLPSVPNYGDYTVEEDVFRVRLLLWKNKAALKRTAEVVKERKIPVLSESSLMKLLKESRQTKYRDRPSPAFSANELCGAVVKGNDKKLYTSEKNKAGVCVWQ